MLLSELEELDNILDSLIFENEASIFNETNALDLIESALHLMEEYMTENPTAITEPDFHESLLEEINSLEKALIFSVGVDSKCNIFLSSSFNFLMCLLINSL